MSQQNDFVEKLNELGESLSNKEIAYFISKNFNRSVVEELKQEFANYTREYLAKTSGLSGQNITQFKNGSNPRLNTLLAFLKLYADLIRDPLDENHFGLSKNKGTSRKDINKK